MLRQARMLRRPARIWTLSCVAILGTLIVGCSAGHSSQVPTSVASRSVAAEPRGTVAAEPRGTVVAFLGDSYTAGEGASAPARRWSSILCAGHGWVERNLGIGGSGFLAGPPYSSRVQALVATHPTVVVVSGGINDLPKAALSLPAENRAVIATFDELRQLLPHAILVALRPFYPAQSPPPLLATIGADAKAAITAVGGVFVNIGEPLRGRPAEIAADGLHPNDSGHRAIARAVDLALSQVRPQPR